MLIELVEANSILLDIRVCLRRREREVNPPNANKRSADY